MACEWGGRGKARVYYMDAATLASSRLGIIRSINVKKEGSHVKAGDELLILDDRLANAQLNTAKKQGE